ncbi:MAG TPA: hypothetical protein ENN66_00775 [Proteobacteria bacterium]|nr:hypothetical protein [Pseudomonadota bacterium]
MRGSKNNPFSSEGKPYFFDQGTADQMATCYSCHPGGGPAEGIVNSDGSVTPYDDPSLTPLHTYDRDFYGYTADDVTMAIYGGETIAESVANIGEPKAHDWGHSGVMEADCLLCHIDPESSYTYRAADGLKVQPFRPRMMIFAERNQDNTVSRISLGMPSLTGLRNSSALYYSNDPQRMGRPTPMLALAGLPKEMVGEMMQMWVDGLANMEAHGLSLPFALYGQNVPKIWDQSTGMLKAEYCANPNGVADEMGRLQGAQAGIMELFGGFLQYLIGKNILPPDADMNMMMGVFFNDFVYAYQIKYPMPGMDQLLPVPYGLRAYEPGKFYTDWDNPHASVRDYVRSGLIEGEGIPYAGRVGEEWSAAMFAMGMIMQGDYTYFDPTTGQPDMARVIDDLQQGKLPENYVAPVMHKYLPSFFDFIPVTGLMGLDFNGDGAPVTYVRIDRNGEEWQPKAYYNIADLNADGALPMSEMFGGVEERNSWKWVKVCGQCHVMTKDHGNSEWTYGRHYNLGMPSDWVKNGQYVNLTDDPEAKGYDVHMSSRKMGCGTCHLREGGSLENVHNFKKGVDTAHMVRNDLDANPRPKSCEGCHLAGEDMQAVNPSASHEKVFGESTGRHLAVVACQTCHVPYKKSWRFRAFDDTLGCYTNFDNLLGYNILPGGDAKVMAFPLPAYAIAPVYSTSPGYGIPHFHMVANHLEADGKGIQPSDFLSQMADYFYQDGESDPGRLVNGMPTNFKFDFWKYFLQANYEAYKAMGVPLTYDPVHDNEVFPPLYYANGINGYPQVVIGNPITVMTWVDTNPQPDTDMSDLPYGGAKVLYLKEINAAIKAYHRPVQLGMVDPMQQFMIPANDPTWAANPNVGKIILKESGYVIFDHNGDMFPDIWWDEDVKAMREALVKVLKAEGAADPKPAIFMAAHYFSDSHAVLPAGKALGAQSCNDCHGDAGKDAGAHRVTDRLIQFLPWAPPWFRDENRLMTYDPEHGMVAANPNGLFLVNGEVAYIQPQMANNMSFLGARADEILKLSHHHAEELFTLTAEGSVTGDQITEIDPQLLTTLERSTSYHRQVVNGPWMDKTYFYIPEELEPSLTACGFTVGGEEEVYLSGRGFARAYVLRYELASPHEAETGAGHEHALPATIIRLPFTGSEPEIWTLGEHDTFFRPTTAAEIVGHQGAYVLVKVSEPGEYVAVEPGAGSGNQLLYDLWGAFFN